LITGSQELPGWNVHDGRDGDLTTKPLDMGSPKT
jgi:NADH dehydrogenase